MKKALVLGSVSRAVLAVARSLGRAGVQVHLAWNDPGCVSLRSRYVRRAHPLPAFSPTDPAWRLALCDLMRRGRFDLVIPCSDVDTLACHRHRAEIGRFGRLYVPNPEACEVLFDKMKTNDLARATGVRVPREVVAGGADAAPAILDQVGLPLVLKPRRTFDPDRPEILPQVRKVYSAEEFRQALAEMTTGGPVAVQENFIGQGVGVELLLDAGRPLLAFQHVRVHEPLHGGQSAYRKSTALAPELLAAATRLLGAVRYHGVAMVEFKLNPATGQWVFIEVNARFWGSLPLAVACGADFPLALYQFLVEGRRTFPQEYRQGLFCRNLTLDLEWQVANLLADRRDPTLASRPLGRVLGETVVNLLTLRERIDTAALDDPAPFVAECLQLARRILGRMGRRFRGSRGPARQGPATRLEAAPA